MFARGTMIESLELLKTLIRCSLRDLGAMPGTWIWSKDAKCWCKVSKGGLNPLLCQVPAPVSSTSKPQVM